ncbi:hypothetical protein GBAR_LOCUS26705 [Geodia barretti]|uniref:Uncharacterized protein n=1 Tax=Geodia barretti TaxID=519541 RepID=A0AA35XEF0_GEOBA|nr:hypothetical protein GBAR_LOCUS26705 [Geodia barretti]
MSEKIRLAPPKNSSLLFKSFAVKDILSVQKCSKNRRIVCVSVWKSRRTPPQCHALRCPSALVSSALYDSILDQTQNVDDIASSSDKLSSSRLTTLSPESSTTDHPFSTNDRDLPTPPPMTPDPSSPQSPSQFHIDSGSPRRLRPGGRHDSVNEIIQKVLTDQTPMGSREISVWLSQAQLRLVDMSDEREMVFEAHETSRIRAIGVYLEDKRFIGYIVKEEGKPLLGHVLRCNSAALMVSLVSFLRQAVQITFSQQGGSLYDELSSDESDSEPSTESAAQGQGLFKRLRCIANPHKPLCQTSSQPTFVSHTPPPPHSPNSHQYSPAPAVTSFKTPPPLSPLDVPEEQLLVSQSLTSGRQSPNPLSRQPLSCTLSPCSRKGAWQPGRPRLQRTSSRCTCRLWGSTWWTRNTDCL